MYSLDAEACRGMRSINTEGCRGMRSINTGGSSGMRPLNKGGFKWHATPKYRVFKWHETPKYRGLKWHARPRYRGLPWHALYKYRGLALSGHAHLSTVLPADMDVRRCCSVEAAGPSAAAWCAAIIIDAVERNGTARVVLATGASQFHFLAALRRHATGPAGHRPDLEV